MKKITVIFLLIFISSLFAGCIVQSLHPFYTEKALIELPQLEGEWLLLTDAGDDVSEQKIKPWIFTNDEIQTFDAKGISSVLKVKYFKIDNTIFMDITADDPDETRLNQWWFMHVVPVHSVVRVTIKNNTLILTPLDYYWVEDAMEAKEISLPHIERESENMIVFNADPETWMAFLKKYRNDKEAFSDKLRSVLKRHRQHEDNLKTDNASAREDGRHRGLPPYELIEGNVRETDVTVALVITDVTQMRVIRSDNGRPGYIVHKVSAKVFRSYKGEIKKGSEIVYHRFLEAGIEPPETGTRHIVSFKKKNGLLVIPDTAYHFEYSESLHKLFEKAVSEL